MYKAILVDDEYAVRESIINCIDWEKHGFNKIMTYPSGKEAARSIESGNWPDLVITDIGMSFADNFKLLEYARKDGPRPVVIMISGSDYFKFVTNAVNLKECDYIIKPVTVSGLYKTIDSAKAALDNRKDVNKRILELENSLDDALPILRTQLLRNLIKGKTDESIIKDKLHTYGICMDGCCFEAAVIDIDSINSVISLYGNTAEDTLKYAVFNIVQELALHNITAEVFQDTDGKTVMIFRGWDDRSPNPKEFISEAAEVIKKNLGFTVSAGIGQRVGSLNDIPESFSTAEYALSYRFFSGEGSVISKNNITEHFGNKIDFTYYESNICRSLKTCEKKEACLFVGEFIKALKVKNICIDKCISYIRKMVVSIMNTISKLNVDDTPSFFDDMFELANKIPVSTLAKAGDYLCGFCCKFFDYTDKQKKSGAEAIIMKSKQYIREHCEDPQISLTSMATSLSVSVSYFCAIFKKYTGKTFLAYLNGFRMEKAKVLLKSTGKSIYEIAGDVGYADQHYFSIAFKKYTGVTPKSYRNG